VRLREAGQHRQATDDDRWAAEPSSRAVSATAATAAMASPTKRTRLPDTAPRWRRGPGLQHLAASPDVLGQVEGNEQRVRHGPADHSGGQVVDATGDGRGDRRHAHRGPCGRR
jgi:hypothetical protein